LAFGPTVAACGSVTQVDSTWTAGDGAVNGADGQADDVLLASETSSTDADRHDVVDSALSDGSREDVNGDSATQVAPAGADAADVSLPVDCSDVSIDCAGSCGGARSYCANALNCGLPSTSAVNLTPSAPSASVVLPPSPVDFVCGQGCLPGTEVWYGVKIDLPAYQPTLGTVYVAEVDPPWQLTWQLYGSSCSGSVPAPCVKVQAALSSNLFAVTSDPAAPAARLRIRAAKGLTCP
jgi:hypothetical protein